MHELQYNRKASHITVHALKNRAIVQNVNSHRTFDPIYFYKDELHVLQIVLKNNENKNCRLIYQDYYLMAFFSFEM